MIVRKIPEYNFGKLDFRRISDGGFLKDKFYISLPLKRLELKEEKTFFLVPGALEIRLIKRSFGDKTGDIRALREENCFYFKKENEWILEALCHMQTDDGKVKETFVLRLPLSCPGVTEADVGLYCDGVRIAFIKDGELLNENYGLDEFCLPAGAPVIDASFESIRAARVGRTEISYRRKETEGSADFYFPHGWNTNVGDVMNFYHNGTYHLVYLLDRRHHGSRGGGGAHYFAHLTSENLTDWYDQTPLIEIDKPWQTYGTGTMLFHNGRYYMTYGLHTERYNGKAAKVTPEYDEKTRAFKSISFEEIFKSGGVPGGASYSVSDSGIDFTPSGVLFHGTRNPSAYVNQKGGITLFCGSIVEGIFESEGFEKPFIKSEKQFEYAWKSVVKNNSDCPAFFEWNGYKYLPVGFTGYFRTLRKGSDDFTDAAAMGESIYDGLSVPMVASYGDRRIMAGWVRSPLGLWGGVLMQRELIQEEDGKLGMKWLPEFEPLPLGDNIIKAPDELRRGIRTECGKSYYLRLTLDPEKAEKAAVSFNDGKRACTFEMDFVKNRIQANNAPVGGFAEEIPTLLEQMEKADKSIKRYTETGVTDIPQRANNYSLAGIPAFDRPFTIKMRIIYSRRMNSTVLDAEIAGRRTMISVRGDFFPTGISLISSGKISVENAQLNEISVAE